MSATGAIGAMEAPGEGRRANSAAAGFSAGRAAYAAALVGLLLVAYLPRAVGLNDYGLWYDEGHSAAVAALPPTEILAVMATDVHPPLYFLLLNAWLALAGDSEFALRYLSVCLGVLTVAAGWKLAHVLCDRRAAWTTGWLLACSPLLVVYSREARMYVLAALLVTLAAVFTVSAWRGGGSIRWAGLACALAAALYTHYYTALVAVALALFGLAQIWRQSNALPGGRAAAWATSQLAVLVAIAPLAPNAMERLSAYGSDWLPRLGPLDLGMKAFRAVAVGPMTWEGADSTWVGVAALVGAIALLSATVSRTGRDGATLATVWLLLAAGVVIYAAAQRPMFHPRYLVQAAPAYCLVLGIGLSRGGKWLSVLLAPTLAVALAIGVYGLVLAHGSPHDDARGTADWVAAHLGDGDLALVDTDHPFVYYSRRTGVAYEILPAEWPGDRELLDRLNRIAPGYAGLFHVQWKASSYDAKSVVEFYLSTQSRRVAGANFDGFRVDQYHLPPAGRFVEPRLVEARTDFGGVVALVGAGIAPALDANVEGVDGVEVVAGGALPLALRWRMDSPHPRDLSALVQLVDEKGHAVSRTGRRLVNSAHMYSSLWGAGEESTNFYLLEIPPGTPPAPYDLRVFVHWDGTVSRLDILDEAGRPMGTELSLARVRVLSPLSVGRPPPPPPVTVRHSFGDVVLVSAEVPRTTLDPGQSLEVGLEWWAARAPGSDYQVQLSLAGGEEARTVSLATGHPAYGHFPTSRWTTGELVRERWEMPISARTEPGVYVLAVSLLAPDGHQLPGPALNEIVVRAASRVFDLPPVPHPTSAVFGEVVELLGYDLSGEVKRAGAPLRLSLYWRCLAEMDTNYTVFTHLLGPADVVWGQHDSMPLGGLRPTSGWTPGEVLTDRYELTLRDGAPAGSYRLQVGLYDARTMERLPVVDASGRVVDDRVILIELAVED